MKRLVIIEDQTAIRENAGGNSAPGYELPAGRRSGGRPGPPSQLCNEVKPDVLVLDAKLPGLNGVDILRRLNKRLPHMRVLSSFRA